MSENKMTSPEAEALQTDMIAGQEPIEQAIVTEENTASKPAEMSAPAKASTPIWKRFKISPDFSNGLIRENAVLVGLLGMCPTLAVTNTAQNGIGMGLSTTFVLIFSNLLVSLLKNFIPKTVRLPSYIIIITGLVTLVTMILQRYIPFLYDALGIYLPLIAVNCIILGRAEVFASKNPPLPSILDGLGTGLGFTAVLLAMGSVRELAGSGSWMGLTVPFLNHPMLIFIMPAGGFFVLGCLIALVNRLAKRKPPQELNCHSCPNSEACAGCTMKEEEVKS